MSDHDQNPTTDYSDPEKDHGSVSRIAKRLWPEAWLVSGAVPCGDAYARHRSLEEAARVINVVLEECYGDHCARQG